MLLMTMEGEHTRNYEKERGLAALIEREPQLAFLPRLYEALPQAEWYLVGGAVRDLMMGRGSSKDYDLVVRRAKLEDLESALRGLGQVDLVGRNFGVLKFQPETAGPAAARREPVDIAWPRTERAGGSGGYRDFQVQSDPELPIETDLARRDFTINAVAWDLKLQRVIDPFDGRGDLSARTIRAVGEPADRFAEDYSRMLRAIRLSCQLGFGIEPRTWEAVKRQMAHIDDVRTAPGAGEKTERVVPYETIAKELIKGLAADPGRCVELYEESGALFRLMPELQALRGCGQSDEHHSEGDVWAHTKLALSKLSGPEFDARFPGERCGAEEALAVLYHDSGKPMTAVREADKLSFYGHEEKGAGFVRSAAERLKLASYTGADISPDRLAWLVRNHLFPNLVRVGEVKKTTLAKYFLADRQLGRELLHLAFADASASIPAGGRPDLSNLDALMKAVAALESQVGPKGPTKLLSGGEVMSALGLQPGPEVGRILEALTEAQLQGIVTTAEEAREFLKTL